MRLIPTVPSPRKPWPGSWMCWKAPGWTRELRPNAIWPAFRKAWRRRGLGVSCRKRRPFDLADAPAPCKQHPTRAPTRAPSRAARRASCRGLHPRRGAGQRAGARSLRRRWRNLRQRWAVLLGCLRGRHLRSCRVSCRGRGLSAPRGLLLVPLPTGQQRAACLCRRPGVRQPRDAVQPGRRLLRSRLRYLGNLRRIPVCPGWRDLCGARRLLWWTL